MANCIVETKVYVSFTVKLGFKPEATTCFWLYLNFDLAILELRNTADCQFSQNLMWTRGQCLGQKAFLKLV